MRDYIHVLDLADAHLLALDFLRANEPRMEIYNLGCGGEGHTIREVDQLRGERDGKADRNRDRARGGPAIRRCWWRLQTKPAASWAGSPLASGWM